MRHILLLAAFSLMIFACNKRVDPYSGFSPDNHLKPKINTADFYKMSGFDFGWLLLEPINIAKSPNDEPELAMRLSPGQKALYFWWHLDAEVTNGGFTQFYFNGKGKYLPAIVTGMEVIGDEEMVDLIQKAQTVYNQQEKAFEDARLKEDYDAFSELYDKVPELSEFDSVYYSLHDQTMTKIEQYAKQNPDEFCVDENGNEMQADFTGTVTSVYENGNIKDSFAVVNGIVDGVFTSFYEDGRKRLENNFIKGEQIGEQMEWKKDGTLERKVTIDQHKNEICELFYPNGQVQAKRYRNKDGVWKGPFKSWWENGQLKEEATFVSDFKKIGHWRKYHRDGHVELEAEIKNGEVLFYNYWNEQGEELVKNGNGLYIETNEHNGMNGRVTIFRTEQEVRNYKINGVSRSFINDTINRVQEFRNGKEHGKTEIYTKGKLTLVETWDSGVLVSSTKIK